VAPHGRLPIPLCQDISVAQFLQRCVQREIFDHAIKLGLGLVALRLKVRGLTLERFQPRLLIRELLGMTLGEGAFFRVALQRFQIFPQALLIVVDLCRFILAPGDLRVERRQAIFLRDNFVERRFDLGIDGFLIAV
jgi:hypothetical protein